MYSFDSRVRYSEVDSERNLTFGSLLNYLQDCCTFQSEDLGIGVGYLMEHHVAWILSSWQVVWVNKPKMGDRIHISTWPYELKGFYGFRNFTITSWEGEVLAYANSVWVFMDTDSGRPTRIHDTMEQAYELEKKYDMDYAARKIPVPKEYQAGASYHVQVTDIDTNHHVNNERYVEMAQIQLPQQYEFRQMRAEYKKAALLGDEIFPYISYNEDGTQITVLLADQDTKPYAVIEFTA